MCFKKVSCHSDLFCHPVFVLQLVQSCVVGSGGRLFVGPPIVSPPTVAAAAFVPITSVVVPAGSYIDTIDTEST